jgi:hypothetical protein
MLQNIRWGDEHKTSAIKLGGRQWTKQNPNEEEQKECISLCTVGICQFSMAKLLVCV